MTASTGSFTFTIAIPLTWNRLMMDRWFSVIRLRLSPREFHQLPQNPAFKYEYLNETAYLSPHPKFYSARLDLCRRVTRELEMVDEDERVVVHQFEEKDWLRLPPLFADAFGLVEPFARMSDRRRRESARECLNFTRDGNDGPLINAACHVAYTEGREHCLGAILVTLIPMIDLEEFWSMRWPAPPPKNCIELNLGRPHLTWVFVNPSRAGHGIGSALLARAAHSLHDLGYNELLSSFLLGNTSSTLWHWRNGFELLPYVSSPRATRGRRKKGSAGSQGACPPSAAD